MFSTGWGQRLRAHRLQRTMASRGFLDKGYRRSQGIKAFTCLVVIFSAFFVVGCPSNGSSTSGAGGGASTSTSNNGLGAFSGLGPAVSPSGDTGTDTPTNNGSASFITVLSVVL